jgi:glycosyltransferase involved in cell wall biosynthesis
MKILVVSHGHPVFNGRGAENSAHSLHEAYLSLGHDSCFLARVQPDFLKNTGIVELKPREFLLPCGVGDTFFQTTASVLSMSNIFGNFLRSFAPDFVHFHHYSHIGLEMFYLTKKILPNVKTALTLHEYMAVCCNEGQMVKNKSGMPLCLGGNISDCNSCFPQWSAGQFFLRKRYFLETFKLFDFFISPSRFLKEIYVRWGMDEKKIYVMENGMSQNFLEAARKKRSFFPAAPPVVFGFLGTMSKYKGVDLLMEAVASLDEKVKEKMRLEIHGSGIKKQDGEFRKKFLKLLGKTEGIVTCHGEYAFDMLPELLSNLHYVVVPSIWWENSPLVIQEAHAMARPVICSDMGGMREKVRHGVDGIHFTARNAASLRAVLTEAATNFPLWQKLSSNCHPAPSVTDTALSVLDILTPNSVRSQSRNSG